MAVKAKRIVIERDDKMYILEGEAAAKWEAAVAEGLVRLIEEEHPAVEKDFIWQEVSTAHLN